MGTVNCQQLRILSAVIYIRPKYILVTIICSNLYQTKVYSCNLVK